MDDTDHALGARQRHGGAIRGEYGKSSARAGRDGGIGLRTLAGPGPPDYHDASAVDLAQPGPGRVRQGAPGVVDLMVVGVAEIAGGAAPRSYLGAPRQGDGPRPRRERAVVT
jgi:hypothetical protein